MRFSRAQLIGALALLLFIMALAVVRLFFTSA